MIEWRIASTGGGFDHHWVIYPGHEPYPAQGDITAFPLEGLALVGAQFKGWALRCGVWQAVMATWGFGEPLERANHRQESLGFNG